MKDYSLKFLKTDPIIKKKIEIIKNWVEKHGRIWGRKALYELVSNQLVKDTSDNTSDQNYKLWQNLRENDIVPYDWFRDKRTTVVNVGINNGYSFQQRFNMLCNFYTRSSKSLQDYYVEVWTEKELSDDIQDLLKKYDIGLVMGEGFIGDIPFHDSIKMIPNILEKFGKPIRIFYISDFDCEGEHTYHLCKEKLEPLGDVKVEKLFLTKKQIIDNKFIPNIGYRERMLKPKTLKYHLSKQYVKDFIKDNKYLDKKNPDGIIQYELDQFPIELMIEILDTTISNYIDIGLINRLDETCRKEVSEWLSKHYKEV